MQFPGYNHIEIHVVGEPPFRFHFKGSLSETALKMRRNLRAVNIPDVNSTSISRNSQQNISDELLMSVAESA